MELRPILSALLRNRTGALLVGLQVAITLAVVANAFYIIERRLEKIRRPTGIDTPNLLFVQSYGFADDYDQVATLTEDLAVLRSVPGVLAATPISNIPLSGGGSSSTYQTAPGPAEHPAAGNYYEVDDQFIKTLGLKLLAGRGFRPEEFVAKPPNNNLPPELVVTEDMARQLFGDEPAVGKLVYDSVGAGGVIVGI